MKPSPLLTLLALLAAGLLHGAAEDTTAPGMIKRELAEPATTLLRNGQRLTGHPVEVGADFLRLGRAEGGGEVIHTLAFDEILELRLPGESFKAVAVEWIQSGEEEAALDLLDLLFDQRAPLLPLLEDSESHFFVHYLRLVLQSGNPARAIAITERLRPQIRNPEALRVLENAVLEGYDRLALHEQALPLAEIWVSGRRPYGDSALGYYVLASARLRAEKPHEALETALRPIVFSAGLPMDYLPQCYALAIAAALELRERPYALSLFKEMRARRLPWPDDPRFTPFLEALKPDET